MRATRTLTALPLALVLALALATGQTGPPTATVQPGSVETIIRLTGAIEAESSAVLRAPYLRGRGFRSASGDFGLVLRELAPAGKWAGKGAAIATFDRLSMSNRLDNIRAETLDNRLRLRTLRSELDLKRANFQRQLAAAKARVDKAALDLKTSPVRSAIDIELFKLALEEAKAHYAALQVEARYMKIADEAELRLAELELSDSRLDEQRAENNLDKLVVRAPVAGLVIYSDAYFGGEIRSIKAGDQLRPGQPFAQIVDPAHLIVAASANQVDVRRLEIGDRARVRLDAYPGLSLDAEIFSIAPLAEPARRRAYFVSEVSVYLRFTARDERLIPNLSASADVVLSRERSDCVVPREAVFFDEESGEAFVYLQNGSAWQRRPVELGAESGAASAVRSGLKPGDIVALAPPSP